MTEITDIGEALNRMARESMKDRLMRDILVDMAVCEIEGWDKLEYLDELEKLIRELRHGRDKNIQPDARRLEAAERGTDRTEGLRMDI
jgi:hypothetical protein